MPHKPWWHGTRGEWYLPVQALLLSLILLAPFLPVGQGAWPAPLSIAARLAGLALSGTGLLLALAAMLRLGSNLSALPHPTDDATLVDTGVYRLVRHPIYAGIIAGSFGWGLLANSLLAMLLSGVLFVFFDIKSRREERMLRARFPDYGRYQARVRKFIPFIY
jgi:protein-S-isoprenylcysteine O-methyltransferase Ste14